MGEQRVVWKAGGSVLVDEDSFHLLAARIEDFLAGDDSLERLYVVVSAMQGVTDSLISQIANIGESEEGLRAALEGRAEGSSAAVFDNPLTAEALLGGEIESAQRLQKALARRGLESRCITQLERFPLVAGGSYLRADLDLPLSVESFAEFDRRCGSVRIFIVSGFGAVNSDGDPVLFGRNAGDYVAALFSALDRKVKQVVFLKDVGGIYKHFGTAGQRLVPTLHARSLARIETGDLLDRRTLDVINCDFRIIDLQMSKGSLVVVGSTGIRK